MSMTDQDVFAQPSPRSSQPPTDIAKALLKRRNTNLRHDEDDDVTPAAPPAPAPPAIYLTLTPDQRAAVDVAMTKVAKCQDVTHRWTRRLAKATDRTVIVSLAVARATAKKRIQYRWVEYILWCRPHLRDLDTIDLSDPTWDAVQPPLIEDPDTGRLIAAPQPKPKKGTASPPATAAPTPKPKVTPAGKLSDPPPELYAKEYRNPVITCPKWAQDAVVALIGGKRTESVGSLHYAMGHLIYWSKPTDRKGRRRDPETDPYLVAVDGLTWVRISPTKLHKALGVPLEQIRWTLKRLVDLGAVEKMPPDRVKDVPRRDGDTSYGGNTTYMRIAWEVVLPFAKPSSYTTDDADEPKAAPKNSKKR